MRKKISMAIIGVISIFIFAQLTHQTIAWLINESNAVTNTFAFGKIEITLTETDTGIDEDDDENTNTYLLDIEDTIINKDAVVEVKKESEDCWLFVKIEEQKDLDKYISYEMDEKWTILNGYENIYYMEVKQNKEDLKFNVFKDQSVKLIQTSKDVLNNLTKETYPQLQITAYAIQQDEIDTVFEAWEIAKEQSTTKTGVNDS